MPHTAGPGAVTAALAAVVTLGTLGLVAPGAARADGDVTITLNPDGQQLATELGLDVAELERRIEAELADAYDTANVDGFLRAFANATSFASRGVGVDYAPLFHDLELGFTANLAAAVDGLEDGEDPAGGVAPNLSLMAGLNLSRWGHPALTIYANGLHRRGSLDQFSGSITNLGGHVQYHLAAPARDASSLLFLWSGLHLTAGLELSRWSFHADDGLTRDVTIAGDGGASTDVTADALGRFDLGATATTIPIEVTTSARFLYVAGLYLGGGLDIQLGKADASADLSGTLTATRPSDQARVDVGTARVTASGDGSPSPIAYHLLAGVEANLWRLKAFVHATLVPFDGASVALGLRLRL